MSNKPTQEEINELDRRLRDKQKLRINLYDCVLRQHTSFILEMQESRLLRMLHSKK